MSKLCTNPCRNNPNNFVHYSEKTKLCYNSFNSATTGAGGCDSWCTLDVNIGTGCGDTRYKMCD